MDLYTLKKHLKMNKLFICMFFLLIACSSTNDDVTCMGKNLGLSVLEKFPIHGTDISDSYTAWQWKKDKDTLKIRWLYMYPVWNSLDNFSIGNYKIFDISGDCPVLIQRYTDYTQTEEGANIPPEAVNGILTLELMEFELQDWDADKHIVGQIINPDNLKVNSKFWVEFDETNRFE